jgi:hypothetical protein
MDSIRDGAFGLTNTNRLVRFYRGCTGLKTGSTSKAGFCISATAERDGTVATTCPLGTVYNEPCFGIAQTVEVTRQTHDITLTGIARCYALVLDRSTTYAYRIHTGNIIDALAIFPAGDIATVFVKPSAGGTAGIVAIGTGGDEKEYNVSWLTTTGGTHLDTGCWYCFPGPATKVGTTLAVTHGAWTAGTIAN